MISMSTHGPNLVVIAGPNGAGKSTLAPLLLRDNFGLMEYVNADTIALGLSAFQPQQAALEAGRIMLKRLDDLARQRASFAFETTLASRSFVPRIKRLCNEGYDFHLLFLWLRSVDLAIERVKERMRFGGHDVPESVILRRYAKGAQNFFRLYRRMAETWAAYDNSFSGEPTLVATGSAGDEPIIHMPDLWKTFSEGA